MDYDRPEPPSPGLDDAELKPSLERSPPPPERLPAVWPKVAAAVVVVLALAAGAWYFFFRGEKAAPPAAAPAEEVATGGPSEAAPPPAEEEIELPPLPQSDPLVRELVGRLSSNPRLASWLATDDLVRRFVVTVDNLAEGRSPAVHLRFLDPGAGFQARQEGGRLRVDPASYRRYDLLTGAFVSLDTEGAARLYRRLEPLIDQAYRDLGYPDRDFDDTLARALGRLLAVPVTDGDLALTPREADYGLADPTLESLSPAAKHLLRMGPDNARRVQAKLRQLTRALGIEPRAP